jgi:hypothetical protein
VSKKKSSLSYYTIGVRFLDGLHVARVYTYRVQRRVVTNSQVHLGQELVADTPYGSAVVVVVRIDAVPQDSNPRVLYKYITRKVAPL